MRSILSIGLILALGLALTACDSDGNSCKKACSKV